MRKGNNKANGKRKARNSQPAEPGMIMPFAELQAKTDTGRNQLYRMLADGVFPTIKTGRRFRILRVPTEAILRGEMPPGSRS
jgi:hypothetical protein